MNISRRIRILLTVISVCGIGIILLSAQSSSEIRSVEASLFVEFINGADYAFNLSGYVYVYGEGFVRFNNTEVVSTSGENFTLIELDDGSGMYFDLSQLRPRESVEFQINRIQVGETLHQNISSLRFSPSFHSINSTDVDYMVIFKVVGETAIGTIPTASKHIFTVKLAEKNVLIESDCKTNVLEYLASLHIIASFMLVGLCLSFYFRVIREFFPFITLIFVMLTIYIYVFIGSGWEINYMSGMEGFKFLAFASFLVHGYYGHITNNLVYFGLLSVLIETICLHGGNRQRRTAQWYLLPLIVLSLLGGIQFLKSGKFSFGLSFAIEAMTWVLWAFIIKNFRSVVTRRIHAFLIILSGIPSCVFLGWLVSYLFYPTRNPHYRGLAEGHVWFGVVSAIIVFLLVFGDGIVGFVRKHARAYVLGTVDACFLL